MTSTSSKNNSNIMEWTREKTLFLINEYRARRGLWDMTHDDYRKKEVKQKLLVEVSESLGGNIPISEIEKKFHTLRTQYHREINRMKRKEPYNSKWFGFKNLQFLSSPKACRTNKARLRSEITEEGTVVTTKMESVIQDTSGGGSNNSEEFLTVTTATNRSTPSNSRSQFEKLIEETTKDVEEDDDDDDDDDEEDENMETKPKVTYKEITLPIHHGQQSYSAHIHVNPDLSVTTTSHEEHQQHNSSDESILPIEMPEDNDVYGHDEQHMDTQHHHHQQPQPQHHPTQIIKIQKRDASYHNDYYDDHDHVATKRIYYEANGKTTTIVTSPTQTIKANVISSGGNSNGTATGGVIQTRHITPNTVNIKGRLHSIKPPPQTQTQSKQQQQQQQTQPQPQQPGQKPPAPRDAFLTYGEYVANEMRSIHSREILISLKHKINTALFEAHMAELQK